MQSQLPFAAVRRQQGRESPDFGAGADPVMSEGGVVFPSAESSQVIVPGTPPTPPESPYRHDSQAAQRAEPSTPPPPRQLTPEQIEYLQAEQRWRQEQLERQRQAELDQRSFQAGLRSDRAFDEGEFPVTRTAPGRNPNQLDYSIPYQTLGSSWQHRMGITQQQQRDIDEQRRAIATAAAEQRQQTREIREARFDRLADLADLARRRDRDHHRQGGGRRNSAITASKRKKIKQSKRKSKYTRKSNKNKMQRKKSQRRRYV